MSEKDKTNRPAGAGIARGVGDACRKGNGAEGLVPRHRRFKRDSEGFLPSRRDLARTTVNRPNIASLLSADSKHGKIRRRSGTAVFYGCGEPWRRSRRQAPWCLPRRLARTSKSPARLASGRSVLSTSLNKQTASTCVASWVRTVAASAPCRDGPRLAQVCTSKLQALVQLFGSVQSRCRAPVGTVRAWADAGFEFC